jgi:hypothetical protein
MVGEITRKKTYNGHKQTWKWYSENSARRRNKHISVPENYAMTEN